MQLEKLAVVKLLRGLIDLFLYKYMVITWRV